MMTCENLVGALRRMKVQTGSLVCLGCGFEHNCGINGCSLIRQAADAIERLNDFQNSQIMKLLEENANLRRDWISVKDRRPEDCKPVLVIVNGKPRRNITLQAACEVAAYTSEGWILEMWPEWEDADVKCWMPLPEPPKEEDHD